MSSIQSTAKGYRAQVAIKGQRDSQTFPSKREAQQWAAKREIELRSQAAGNSTTKTLADAFKRYAEEVSPKRKGWRVEQVRLDNFTRTVLPCKLRVGMVEPEHIAVWRDIRLKEVAPGTVIRELGLLSSVFEVARREWKWIDANPIKSIRKPAQPAHRERLIAWSEIKRMLRALDHHPRSPAKTITQSIALCFLAALRTGMRASELTELHWDKFHGHYIRLDMTKTGVARDVPLSTKSRRVFERARGFDAVSVFCIVAHSRDSLFRRARDKAGLSGFTFHDARHTAATWLGRSGKVQMLEMCKIFGWRDPKHALVYFNPTVSDLAAKLG